MLTGWVVEQAAKIKSNSGMEARFTLRPPVMAENAT
jgi:hypothetical protein